MCVAVLLRCGTGIFFECLVEIGAVEIAQFHSHNLDGVFAGYEKEFGCFLFLFSDIGNRSVGLLVKMKS